MCLVVCHRNYWNSTSSYSWLHVYCWSLLLKPLVLKLFTKLYMHPWENKIYTPNNIKTLLKMMPRCSIEVKSTVQWHGVISYSFKGSSSKKKLLLVILLCPSVKLDATSSVHLPLYPFLLNVFKSVTNHWLLEIFLYNW